MSYVSNDARPSECDPGWVEWAEHETVTRLRDQLTQLRAARELRRATEQQEEDQVEIPAAVPDECEPVVRHSLSAMNSPPDPRDPAWQGWAETQTVLRLRRDRGIKATPPSSPSVPRPEPSLVSESNETTLDPEPESELRLEIETTRTIRIHHDNLRTVGV